MGTTLISTLGWGISALASLIVALIVTRAYLKEKDKPLKYLSGYIWFRFGFFIFVTLALPVYLLTGSGLISGLIFTLWWTFVFLSFLWLPPLYCHFRDEGIKNWLLGATGILVAVSLLMLWTNFTPATYSPETGAIFQPIPEILGMILYPFPKLMLLTLLIFLFLGQVPELKGKLKKRSLLFGLGFLMIATTIVLVPLLPPFWNGLWCCIGDLLLLAGVMTRPTKKE